MTSVSILNLPDEANIQTLSYLDMPDLGTVANVCTKLRELQADRSLWKRFLDFFQVPLQPNCSEKESVRQAFLTTELTYQSVNENGEICVKPCGMLNTIQKTITFFVNFFTEQSEICTVAMTHPLVPNQSFVVYALGSEQIPSAVVKNENGRIINMVDTTNKTEDERQLACRTQDPEKPFHQFNLVLQPADNDFFTHYFQISIQQAFESFVNFN